MEPFFSIVVPVYNVSKYILAALNSIKIQTFRNFEAIVIDDGSTDDSNSKISEFIKHDERFNLIQIENSGLGVARNVGVKKVSGKYLLFLDSDDLFDEKLLENIFKKINSCKLKPDVVVFDIDNFDSDTKKKIGAYVFDKKLEKYSDVAWNKAYRTEFYKKNKFEYPAIKFEDTPITHIIMALSENPVKLNFKGYYYRRNRKGSITSTNRSEEFKLRCISLTEFYRNVQKYDVRLKQNGKKTFVESKLIKAIIYLLIENQDINRKDEDVKKVCYLLKKMHPLKNAILIKSIKEFIGSIFVFIKFKDVFK